MFSADYASARERFLQAAAGAGAALHSLALEARGPQDQPLSIDIAWCGPAKPSAALLHVSGVHGVEAFAGSAIQSQALGAGLRVPGGCALILVHALNPWGMAWCRRANEHNVDLNRNFLSVDEAYTGAPAVYPALRELLAPQRPPGPDLFAARALWAILRYGRSACRDAILGGQYEDPRGLFFGGHQLEPGPTRYQAWMHDHLAGLGYLLCLDVHTGLGRYGRELLLYERNTNHTPADQLGRALEHRIQTVPAGGTNAYAVRGGFCRMPCRLLPQARVDFLTQEFGTYRMLHLLRVLRAENQAFHHLADSREWRTRLREALDPPDAGWREQVLKAGLQRLQAGLRWLERARIRAA